MWPGMKSETSLYGLSFRGTYWLFCVPFLGVGVEVKQRGRCLSALGTAEVSQQPASIVPLCTLGMGIYGRSSGSVKGHSPVIHRALGSIPSTSKMDG